MKKIFFIIMIITSYFLFSEEKIEQDDIDINLWPILSYKDTPDGGKNLSALLIFNRKVDKQGNQEELFLFPLFYNINRESGNHFGSLLYFKGPNYNIIPPLLSGYTIDSYGIKTTWITPLFHLQKDINEKILNLHLLNYFYSPNSHILAPLAWNVKTKSGKHHGIIPLYAKGPDYWTVPLGLSLSWKNSYNEQSTWITPLFHKSNDLEKNIISSHFLTGYYFNDFRGDYFGLLPLFLKGPDYLIIPPILTSVKKDSNNNLSTWITPIFHITKNKDDEFKSFHFLNIYVNKDKTKLHTGVVPIFFSGPNYWVIPPLLSGHIKSEDNSVSTWLTPLFHITNNKDKELESFHLLNTYVFNNKSGFHSGFVPLWFHGPSYWFTPPLLSANWTTENKNTHTWITPLFHQKKSANGQLSAFHYFNFYGYKTDDGWKKGFAPFWYIGPNYLFSPLLLSGEWTNNKGEKDLWITPLFHKKTDLYGDIKNMFILNYYSFKNESGVHRALFPIIFDGPDYTVVPPLLSGYWEDRLGDKNLWISPLFHKTKDEENNLKSYHVLNFSGNKTNTGWEYNLFPIFEKSKNKWASPILLSAGWLEDQKSHLWLTPLFHITTEENKKVESFHIGPYINFENKKHILFPIAWYFGKEKPSDEIHYGLLPLMIGGSDYFFSPLGYGFGEKDDFHFGLFPLFSKSPKSLIIPPLLTATWENDLLEKKTWITPLFHKNQNYKNETTSLHLINYYYTPNFSTFFPIYFSWKTMSGNYSMLTPPLFGFFNGEKLNESILFHLQPITFQKSNMDFEFNFLWKLFHLKKDKIETEITIGPLWHSTKPIENKPMEYQILGGLFARDVNYIFETLRYRVMWLITLVPWESYLTN